MKTKKIQKPDWHRIITLSAAGHYIQKELVDELAKVSPIIKRKKK